MDRSAASRAAAWRRAGRCGLAVLGLGLVLCSGPAPAGARKSCGGQCNGDLDCERRVAACLRAQGEGSRAIERLKKAVDQHPDRVGLKRLLAATYQGEGNTFWAQRTLQGLVEQDPADCASRAWLAWTYLQQGDLDLAADVLQADACPATATQRGRWQLLHVLIARAQEEAVPSGALAALGRRKALYQEDARAVTRLHREVDPAWMPPLRLRAELLAGGTSNLSAGLPTTQAETEASSPLSRLELSARASRARRPGRRAVLEMGLRGRYLQRFDGDHAEAVRGARYLELFVRPGIVHAAGAWRASLGYRAELFLLNQQDAYGGAPQMYHEGHRGEVELETPGGFTLFAGAGRRLFRRRSRSRWEVDGGLGWSAAPTARLHVLLAMSLRRHAAAVESYSQTGGSLLAVSRYRLPRSWQVRLGATLGRDEYGDVEGEAGGRDLLTRSSVEVWAPAWNGLQVGASHEYTRRRSTAAVSYGYSEHRGTLRIRTAFDLNPFGPELVGTTGRVPLPVDGGADQSRLGAERIRDLLRRDEAARRSSSCAN